MITNSVLDKYCTSCAVANPFCQERQSERTFPIFAFFFPIFPLFSPIFSLLSLIFFHLFPSFPIFLANFSLSEGAPCPSLATLLCTSRNFCKIFLWILQVDMRMQKKKNKQTNKQKQNPQKNLLQQSCIIAISYFLHFPKSMILQKYLVKISTWHYHYPKTPCSVNDTTFLIGSIPQMCINLANEQLQNFFNEHIFLQEQEECEREGISLDKINFTNNKPVVDVFLEVSFDDVGIISKTKCGFQ